MELQTLGWNPLFESRFSSLESPGLIPARVAQEHRELYLVFSEVGELSAEVSGRFRHQAGSRADFPSVGDWVAVTARPEEGQATIHAVLPRKSSFSRKAVLGGGSKDGPGKTDEQVLAANVDTVFLVTGLDGNFSLRRMERYIAAAWDSGAEPVIVLNKADLCSNLAERTSETETIAVGVPIHAVSAVEQRGLEVLHDYLGVGRTVAFLGSSGVGKSTLINALLGEERQKINPVREFDDKGRHTTTHREMILLPSGGIVIDTPGLREIQLWGDESALNRAFEDIEELASRCRFVDCRHGGEPGCSVQEAVHDGRLSPQRLDSYIRLLKEQKHLQMRKNLVMRRSTERARDRRYKNHKKMLDDLRRKGLR